VRGIVGSAFNIGTGLLEFLPLWLRQLVVAAGLATLAAVGITWGVRTFLPWAGPASARAAGALVRLVAYLLLVLEYIVTRVLRTAQLRPPTVFYAYGSLVARGSEAADSAVRTFLGALRHLRGTPKWVVVVALVFALGGWNQAQCGSGDVACHRPVDSWRSTTVDWFRSTFADGAPTPTPIGR
jgi:hypothetical protein